MRQNIRRNFLVDTRNTHRLFQTGNVNACVALARGPRSYARHGASILAGTQRLTGVPPREGRLWISAARAR